LQDVEQCLVGHQNADIAAEHVQTPHVEPDVTSMTNMEQYDCDMESKHLVEVKYYV
jgi:hypothetical protein